MSIKIKGIHFFRSTKSISEYSNRVNEYTLNKMYYSDINSIISNTKLLKSIENLILWRSLIIDKNLDFKLRIGQDNITIYTNDFTVFQLALNNLNYSKDNKLITYNYSEHMMNYESGIIYQKTPKRKLRIYMKAHRYTLEQRDKLYDFLKRNDITMSPSLIRWADSKNSLHSTYSGSLYNQWSWDYYFFDLDQESLITILSLKFDNLIRKVCTIQKR
jgi:spermidine/putrescine-binding protein